MEAYRVSQSVMDEYAARILLGTMEQAASALDLSRRYGIPIAACYRRIRRLEAMGLVYCERAMPSRNGKGLQLFRSRLRSMRIILEEGRLCARIEVAEPAQADLGPTHVAEQVLHLSEPTREA